MASIMKTWCAATLLAATACGGDAKTGDDTQDPGAILSQPSRSSTIALTEDGSHIAMVNPDDGSLSIFQTSDDTRTAKVATGGTPSSVALAADSKTAFVANRADGTIVRVTGIDGATPAVDATVQVGAEPIALALSPTGKQLFVAELAESRVSVIDTTTMTVTQSFAVDRPRALLVTNNGDTSDADETLIVPQYYGVPVAGREARDDGRTGRIRMFSLADLTQSKDITLAPIATGFHEGGVDANPEVTAAPNQLGALATANGRIYITSVSAAPDGVTRFDNNVFPIVYVADVAAAKEVRDPSGTTNLARKIYDANPNPSPTNPRFIPGELSDLAFVDGSDVAYAIGRAGDVMVRVTFGNTVAIGSTQNTEIDLGGNATVGKCQGPTGVAIDSTTNKAYVNCWVTRDLAVVDLAAQSMTATVASSDLPTAAGDQAVLRGKRFYFTGRGRWSAAVANGAKGGEGWESCGSCHPDGLTDNITWMFNSGPRQTTSQDGTFSHGPGAQKQRILNWTGIFDELHDFERNTRAVSGGLGAITTAAVATDCNQLDKEIAVNLAPNGVAIGGLQQPLKELADDPNTALCGHKDWDDIGSFVKTIVPVHAKKAVDTAQIARGLQVFKDGGCDKCHGGSGWTVSRLFYAPSSATNTALAAAAFGRPAFFPTTWMYDNAGQNRSLISVQPPIANPDLTGPAEPAPVAIGQAACAMRNVGTFGLPGDAAGTDALEQRALNGALIRAEGRAGFNVPSLYGLALGAPYLHHGEAASLPEVFSDPRWAFHTNAGNANFDVALSQPGKLDDLVAFLFSIDASTPELTLAVDTASSLPFDACPLSFP